MGDIFMHLRVNGRESSADEPTAVAIRAHGTHISTSLRSEHGIITIPFDREIYTFFGIFASIDFHLLFLERFF
jgi:hypothetical protein